MKFDPETIYDLAADTARQLLEQTCSDRDVATIAAIHKKLLNDPTIYMDEPAFTSVCKLLKLAGEQMGNEQAGKAASARISVGAIKALA